MAHGYGLLIEEGASETPLMDPDLSSPPLYQLGLKKHGSGNGSSLDPTLLSATVTPNITLVSASIASGDLAYMEGLDTTSKMDPNYIPIAPHPLAPVTEVIQEINSISMTPQADKVLTTEGFFIAQNLPLAEESTQLAINSNDTVVCNMKKLDMDNSSLEGHSISSTEPKHRKCTDEWKALAKKKKTQPTLQPPDVPE
ncbi:hypothetical protein Ancab_024936 [Ancistrocladus abbreviatus]